MSGLRNAFNEIRRYPSAVVGLVIIALLFVFAAYVSQDPPAEATALERRGSNLAAGPATLNCLVKLFTKKNSLVH